MTQKQQYSVRLFFNQTINWKISIGLDIYQTNFETETLESKAKMVNLSSRAKFIRKVCAPIDAIFV